MRQHGYCIKCDCKKIWLVEKVLYALDARGHETTAMSVTKLVRNYNLPEMVGKFEVLICANPACGYTEWHAYDLNGLTELAKDPKSGVRLVSSEPDSPYR
jgi:predicted nucleic-acid-binding Zn-ribbon protein